MMSFADIGSLGQLLELLGQHRHWAYLALFLGAFFETVIPFSLIVLGELFFLPGALLAGSGVLELWGVMAALYGGGILGDNVSYWMGRRYGSELFDHCARWPLTGRLLHRENYEKGVEFFRRRGAVAVFTARLSGPLSWITPAMAGVFRLNYPTFLRFNTPAVIIGISEFIVVGYFFGNHLAAILDWSRRYGISITVAAASLAALTLLVRRRMELARKRTGH